MNSVVRYLTPATLASTLVAMRSGRKDVFLIVEGGDDIALFSQVFRLSRSNFLDCRGKENLMGLFALVPTKGLDAGTVFLRDRDNDGVSHTVRSNVNLLVTDLYDFEMHLLEGRLFGRVMAEFLRGAGGQAAIATAFSRVMNAAAWIGALRHYGKENDLALDFDGLKLTFLSNTTLEVDAAEMVRKVFARSKIKADIAVVVGEITGIVDKAESPSAISCGKDVLEIISQALSRHYKCCSAHACSVETLGRMLRISATLTDLQIMTLYARLAAIVASVPFRWAGVTL